MRQHAGQVAALSGPRAVDEGFLEHAVLVYGPRKAGTTLLQSLLDGGQALLMIPGELKLKRLAPRKNLPAREFIKFYMQKGRSDFKALIQDSSDGQHELTLRRDFHFTSLTQEQTERLFDCRLYVEKLDEMKTKTPAHPGEVIRTDTSAFVAALRAGRRDYRQWAAKEVGGDDPGRVVDFFRGVFPRAKVVFLVREPAFIVRSIILERRRRGVRLGLSQIIAECIEAQNIINYAMRYAVGREIVVAYEHLTRDTAAEMSRIATALGIPFEPVLCTATTLGVQTVVSTSSRSTKEVFQQPEKWTKDLTFGQVCCIRLFQLVAPFVYRGAGRKYVRYNKLLRALRSRAVAADYRL